jgi:hypothetical protein
VAHSPRSAEEFLEKCNQLMMGQRPEEILRKAHALIADERNWTQEAWARDASGKMVKPYDPAAARWCIEGAVAISSNPAAILPPFFMILLDKVAEEMGYESIGLLNDGAHHATVLRALEEAILRASKM